MDGPRSPLRNVENSQSDRVIEHPQIACSHSTVFDGKGGKSFAKLRGGAPEKAKLLALPKDASTRSGQLGPRTPAQLNSRCPMHVGVHFAAPVEDRLVVPGVSGAVDVGRIPTVAGHRVPGGLPVKTPRRAAVASSVLD